MKTLIHTLRAAVMSGLFAITLSSGPAQIPNTLIHSIPAPPTGVQLGANLGFSVATDGGYTVAGAHMDDTGAQDSGVVKVFDAASGALLLVIPNPSPAQSDQFGWVVAISGTRVVVGAPYDDAGSGDSGRAYVYDIAGATPTSPIVTLTNPTPGVAEHFGWVVAISGKRIVVGTPDDIASGAFAGKAYIYDLGSPTVTIPVHTLDNPSPAQYDQFGRSVAISSTRVIIGAPRDSTGAARAGSAYVYDLSGGTPTVPVLTLNNPSPAIDDNFGYSVAVSGTQVVVGALYDDTGATDAGSAYVYDLTTGTPTVPSVTLNNPSPSVNAYFGGTVATDGAAVVVSHWRHDIGFTDVGSAYVYEMTSVTPAVPALTLNNPSPAAGDIFSSSVAISGTRVVVGAVYDDTAASDAGIVYVYDIAGSTPDEPTVILNHSGSIKGDEFGHSVAISGTRMIVGAYFDDTGANNAGSAYVYDFASGTPMVPVAILNNPSPVADDNFGNSVAISGTRVVVGIWLGDTGAINAGSAYVYDLSSGTPTVPAFTLNNPNPAASDNFGYSVAISGTRVVVGAYQDDTGASNAGSAYVYDLTSGTPTVPVATLNNPSPAASDTFGYSVAISGTAVVVGAHQDDTGATDGGIAYVYNLSSGTPTVPVATLNNPSPAALDYFGYSVAISGTRVVVGAYQDDTGASNAGTAYVYDLASLTPTVPVATLNNPSPVAGDYFGSSVAISGTRIVVGAYFDDTGVNNAGSAYVYDLTSGTPTVPVATLNNPTPIAVDQFGWSVAIDGTTVAIGTPFDDTVMLDKGFAYIFAPADPDLDDDGLLDLWEYARFGSTAAHSALDDTDGDGIVELLELAFNQDPLLPDAAGSPQVVNEGGFLTLSVAKRAGVTYLGQSAASPEAAAFSSDTTTVLVNDATTLKVRDNSPLSAGGQRFLRLKVTAAP